MEEEKSVENTTTNTDTGVAMEMPEGPQEESVTKSNIGRGGKVALAGVLVLILGALVWAGMQQYKNDADGGGPISFDVNTSAPSFDDVPEVVATVGGVELTKQDYVTAYTEAWQSIAQQGMDVNDPAVADNIAAQVLDMMINTEVLAQAADAAGIKVDSSQVQIEIAQLAVQLGGDEGFESAMAEVGLTREKLEESIEKQLVIEAYLQTTPEMAADVVVTDEEVEARYNEIAAQSTKELPTLAEVFDVIKTQLESEAQQAATLAVVERLRAGVEVDMFLEEV